MSEVPVDPPKEGPRPQEQVDKLISAVINELPHTGIRKHKYAVAEDALATRALLTGLIDPGTRVPADVEVHIQSHYKLADTLTETPGGIAIIDPSRGDSTVFWPPYNIGTYSVNSAPHAPPGEKIHRSIPQILERNESGTPSNTRYEDRIITPQERHDLEELVRDFGDEPDLEKALLKLSLGGEVSQYCGHRIADADGNHEQFTLIRDNKNGEPTDTRLSLMRSTRHTNDDGKKVWEHASEEWKFDTTGLTSYKHDLRDGDPLEVDFTKDAAQKDFYTQNAAIALTDILSKKATFIAQQPPPFP